MFLTVHAAAGILIGSKIANPPLAFLLGIISHYFMDIIPHGDEHLSELTDHEKQIKKLFLITSVDSLGVLTVFYFLTNYGPLYSLSLITALIGSLLPDFLWGLDEVFNLKFLKPLIKLQNRLHHLIKTEVSFKIGMLIQIITLALFIFINLK